MQVNNTNKTNIGGNIALAKNDINSANQKDAILKNLNKRLLGVKKKLYSLADNKHLTDKEKEAMRENLNEQLSEIKQLISEREFALKKAKEEELKAKREEQAEKNKINNKAVDYQAEEEKTEFTNLINVTTSLSQVKTQRLTKLNMEKSATRMRIEIEYDESRGQNVPEKREKLSKLNEKIANVESKISENMGKVNRELKKNAKKLRTISAEKAKQEKDEKIKEKEKQDKKVEKKQDEKSVKETEADKE